MHYSEPQQKTSYLIYAVVIYACGGDIDERRLVENFLRAVGGATIEDAPA